MKKLKAGLLPQIIIAIIAGLCLGRFFPEVIVRIFVTFNDLFSNFLNFSIPLIITGLVAPGIAEMGQKAGRALFLTVLLAYGSSVFSGFFTYFACDELFIRIIDTSEYMNPVKGSETGSLTPYFSIEMLPVFNVMTALLLAFTVGVGCSVTHAEKMKDILNEFKAIIERLIASVIIPFLPLYIFGIFMNMSYSGTAMQIISVFGKVIGIIFILHILLLLIQFSIAGIIGKKNPFKLLFNMLPAYVTALGTSSSAATIPVTLEQAKKMEYVMKLQNSASRCVLRFICLEV